MAERLATTSAFIWKDLKGGYEGGGAMTFHDWASPFLPGLEKQIVDEVHYQLGKTYRRPHPHILERNP